MGTGTDLQGWARRQGAPVTLALMASLILAALYFWFTRLRGFEQFVFDENWLEKPWTLVIYPWAGMPFASGLALMFFAFEMMWLYWVGTSVERDLGSLKFLLFWVVMTVLAGIFVWGGALSMNLPFALATPWLTISAVTVAWCTRNPTQTIMLYGIVPLAGRWLGWVTAITVILLMGNQAPALGAVAALHLAVAWVFAANRLPLVRYAHGVDFQAPNKEEVTGRGKVVSPEYFDEVRRREKDREERERLRRLFEGSLDDEK